MASSVVKSIARSVVRNSSSHRWFAAKASSSYGFNNKNTRDREERVMGVDEMPQEEEADAVPTSGISRPLSEILKQLNKRVPDSLVRVCTEADGEGFTVKYIPWHIVNRIMNLHAPEWSGEVRSITYSTDGMSVSVVYRVTLYGTDSEVGDSGTPFLLRISEELEIDIWYVGIYRESIGTASVNDVGYGDSVQKAEAMAFRRACARLGLGLHLYHEDMT